VSKQSQIEGAVEALLTGGGSPNALSGFDPNVVARVLQRIVERDGSFPADSNHSVNGENVVIGPAIRRDPNGTYSIHNCCFFVLSTDGATNKRSRHSLTLEEAVRLYLIAEPFGNFRGYAWAPAYW